MMNPFQRTVAGWLTEAGFQWVEEFPVCGYAIDLYIPELRTGIEIDGPHHNLRRAKDAAREEIIATSESIHIVRVPVGAKKWEVMEALGIRPHWRKDGGP